MQSWVRPFQGKLLLFASVVLLAERTLSLVVPSSRRTGTAAHSEGVGRIHLQSKELPGKVTRLEFATTTASSSSSTTTQYSFLRLSEPSPGASSSSFSSFLGGNVDGSVHDGDLFYENDDDEQQLLLSYLPDAGRNLPPRTKQLVTMVTKSYIYGGTTPTSTTTPTTSLPVDGKVTRTPAVTSSSSTMTLSEIAALIEVEHRSKDVPVVVGKVVADVTQTGEELDEICAEILSFAALYRLPKEITLQLLQSPVSRHPRSRGRSSSRSLSSPSSSSSLPATSTTVMDDDDENEDSSSLIECQLAFAIGGWDVVSFPMGLAIRPKTKYRFGRPTSYEIRKEGGTFRSPLSWMHRTKTLRAAAAAAVTAAASVQPPRRLLDRREFLQSVNAQWQQLDNDDDGYDNRKVEDVPLLASAQAATRGPLYFPNTDRNIFTLWRTLRRVVSKKYTALKKKGRAGFLSYCFFNLVYYTVGILWQWPRMVAGDPLTSNLSIPTLVLRKFGKVFAYLYAVSQLFKLPKLFTAVALAPIAARTLQTLRQKFQIRNETIATAILVGFMFVIWGTVTAIPVLSEYSSLQRILYLDEQLVQVYGFQPV